MLWDRCGPGAGASVVEILDRWVGGAIETERFGGAAQYLAPGESAAHLLDSLAPVPTCN